MEKKIIFTDNAPAPIGPYSQAVHAGNMLFVSGQIPLDASTGQLVTTNIEDETHKVMENIIAILNSAGFKLSDVVKSSIFIKNMNDFARINAMYGTYFTQNPPARETVEVARLPKDVNVEISVIAVKA